MDQLQIAVPFILSVWALGVLLGLNLKLRISPSVQAYLNSAIVPLIGFDAILFGRSQKAVHDLNGQHYSLWGDVVWALCLAAMMTYGTVVVGKILGKKIEQALQTSNLTMAEAGDSSEQPDAAMTPADEAGSTDAASADAVQDQPKRYSTPD
jgi:hypothetical protein